jgi:prepilin-type processing-associated H-X9-DG protein
MTDSRLNDSANRTGQLSAGRTKGSTRGKRLVIALAAGAAAVPLMRPAVVQATPVPASTLYVSQATYVAAYSINYFYSHYSKVTATHGQWNLLYADGHVDAPIVGAYGGGQDNYANAQAVSVQLNPAVAPWCMNLDTAEYSWVND